MSDREARLQMQNKWIVALVVFFTVIVIYSLLDKRMIRNKRKRFLYRQRLDMKQLLSLFPDSKLTMDEFTDFITYVERATEIPREYLRPEDRFDGNLAPERGWEFDDGLILLPEVLYRRFGGTVEDYDLNISPTLAELACVVKDRGTPITTAESRPEDGKGARTINSESGGTGPILTKSLRANNG